MSTATWKVHLKAIATAQNQQLQALPIINQVSATAIPEYSIANLAKPYIGPNSFLNRVASLKRRTPPNHGGSGGGGNVASHLDPKSAANDSLNNKSYVKDNSLNTNNQAQQANNANNEFLTSRRDAIVIPSLFNAQTSVYPYNSNNSPNNSDANNNTNNGG